MLSERYKVLGLSQIVRVSLQLNNLKSIKKNRIIQIPFNVEWSFLTTSEKTFLSFSAVTNQNKNLKHMLNFPVK